jgi:flagellar capping protein FliD
MADDTPPPSSTGWVLNWALTGGTSLVVTLLAIVGNDVRGEVRDINVTQQRHETEIAAIIAQVSTHDTLNAKQDDLFRVELDRRLQAQAGAFEKDLESLTKEVERGHEERLAAQANMQKQFDQMSLRLTEIQRQVSAIEGATPKH